MKTCSQGIPSNGPCLARLIRTPAAKFPVFPLISLKEGNMRIRYPHTTPSLVVILVCSALSVGQTLSAASRFSATFSSPETEASRIVDGSKVMLAYHVTVLGEHEIDYEDVSEFVQGRHEIFRALEQKVAGMRAGEAKKVELTPEEGFGARDESKKMKIPRPTCQLTRKRETSCRMRRGPSPPWQECRGRRRCWTITIHWRGGRSRCN